MLVPGRLLAEITRDLPPHPVEIAAEGPRLAITCSNARPSASVRTRVIPEYSSLWASTVRPATGCCASSTTRTSRQAVSAQAGSMGFRGSSASADSECHQ